MRRRWLACGLGLALGLVACASPAPSAPSVTWSAQAAFASSASSAVTASERSLLVVGDIGDCRTGGDRGRATARLAKTLPGPILLLGDIAYPDGTQANYRRCFWPAWQPLRARAKAVIGNHDARHRSVFYTNWRNSGTSSRPWYSYQVGAWRVLVVDATCTAVSCARGSAQTAWLARALAAHTQTCTMLAMHEPRFSSDDEHGDNPAVDALWRTAYRGGVDLVVTGHAHDYERVGPMGLAGRPTRSGPVELVVGTGGTALRGFAARTAASKVRIKDTFGLVRLTLGPGTWRSQFLAAPSGELRDSASGTCR